MPTYMYKAMTKNGQIVKNSITDINKENCIKRLKENELMPISLTQTFKMMDRTEIGRASCRERV